MTRTRIVSPFGRGSSRDGGRDAGSGVAGPCQRIRSREEGKRRSHGERRGRRCQHSCCLLVCSLWCITRSLRSFLSVPRVLLVVHRIGAAAPRHSRHTLANRRRKGTTEEQPEDRATRGRRPFTRCRQSLTYHTSVAVNKLSSSSSSPSSCRSLTA